MPASSRWRSTTSTSRSTTASTKPAERNILHALLRRPAVPRRRRLLPARHAQCGHAQQLTVSNAHTNIATQLAEGIDYTIRYERDLGPGSFRVNMQATHYIDAGQQAVRGRRRWTSSTARSTTRKTAPRSSLTYSLRNWRFRWGVDWIDSMESYAFLEEDPATSIFDLARRRLPGALHVGPVHDASAGRSRAACATSSTRSRRRSRRASTTAWATRRSTAATTTSGARRSSSSSFRWEKSVGALD